MASPTIFLVNQVSRRGHLDLYARLYSAVLLRLGYRVVLIEEQDSGVGSWLAEDARGASFVSLTREGVRKDVALLARLNRPEPSVTDLGADLLLGTWRRLKGRLIGGVARRWRRLSARAGMPSADEAPYLGGFDFAHLVDEILLAQALLGCAPDLVFFLYLDMMNENGDGMRYLEERLAAPWAGILFHPRYMGSKGARAEYYFRCRNFRGAAFLNSAHLPIYRRLFPRRTFCEVPDVTDSVLPAEPSELARRLRMRAGGRHIVLLVGTIGMHKCVLELLELIRVSDPTRFFFAVVGAVNWDTFGSHQEKLREFFAAPPENFFVHEGYLPQEADINSVIAASDVIYSVYRDFYNSANILTKASFFEKPIIVSDEYLMGERVKHYRTGLAVPPGDIAAAHAALEQLSGRPTSDFGFAEYSRDHSIQALEDVLAKTVPMWLGAEAALCQPTGEDGSASARRDEPILAAGGDRYGP